MIQRKTQQISYWRDEYTVSEEDHEYLYETLADADEPQSLETLVLGIIRRRCQLEESRIRSEIERGKVYDPKQKYEVGDDIVFPAFDFRLGKVLAVRPGDNPEHGEFDVITVRFENSERERHFAANLQTPHRLNHNGDISLFTSENTLAPEDILAEVGDVLSAKVEEHLKQNPDFFVSAGPWWLTADQMVPVNIGHLNIAEAAIEMKGEPVPTPELLAMVELDESVPESVRIFSLETALQQDERFRQVGTLEQPAWFLTRLMPEAALRIPDPLVYEPVEYDRSLLDVELLQTEWELNDEHTDGGLAEEAPPLVSSVFVYLTYPHFISGTLPLPPSAAGLFPKGSGFSTAVTLIDGRWGHRFTAWVVREGRYIAGLGEWFKSHKLPIGARITLERTQAPNEIVVDFKPQRTKREWIRAAYVDEGRLVFQMQRKQLSCDYDDHLALIVPDPDAVAELSAALRAQGVDVLGLVKQIMPELVKLSPQGTAHVRALYSAVNVVRRLPPGPIFAALASIPEATDTGSGFWSL
ncbi:MAG: hypothetical protein D6775_15775 [Caldilineae bacterium]|nr:MAG: hypothetical protein D6775_15775 [Caldilineae bacterium]